MSVIKPYLHSGNNAIKYNDNADYCNMKNWKVVIGYVRVSSRNNAGWSVNKQIELLEEFAEKNNLVMGFYIDHCSGATANRPELKKVMKDITDKNLEIDAIVVAKADRLSRDISFADEINKLMLEGKPVFCIQTGDILIRNARDHAQLLQELAYDQRIRQEHKDWYNQIRKDLVAKGRYLGGIIPFGFKVQDGDLVEDPEEMEAIIYMTKLRDEDGLSYRQIAKKLDEAGYKPKSYKMQKGRGRKKMKKWNHSSIMSIFKRIDGD